MYLFKKLLYFLPYIIFKPKVFFYLFKINNFKYLDRTEVEKHQLNRIKKIIDFAYKNNRFYQAHWQLAGVTLEINDLKDLKKFPIISKDLLREAQAKNYLTSKPFQKKRLHSDFTTGSTGQPFNVLKDLRCYNIHFAEYLSAKKYYDYELGDREIRLWRGSLSESITQKIKFLLTGKKTICIYDPMDPINSRLTEGRIDEIIDELILLKPKYIDAFVSALVLISHRLEKRKIQLTNLKAIVTGAETLDVFDRKKIETAFGVRIFNRYGGTEFGLIGHECELQTKTDHYLHLSEFTTYFELDDQTNELIITDLFNYAMPLIRYKTGDIAIFAKTFCKCGISSAMISEIQGRANDLIVLSDKSYVSSHIWHNYFKKYNWIKKYQIIQDKIDLFTIRLDVELNCIPDDELQEIKLKVEKALMVKPKSVRWEIGLNSVKPGIGGKHQQCISNLKM